MAAVRVTAVVGLPRDSRACRTARLQSHPKSSLPGFPSQLVPRDASAICLGGTGKSEFLNRIGRYCKFERCGPVVGAARIDPALICQGSGRLSKLRPEADRAPHRKLLTSAIRVHTDASSASMHPEPQELLRYRNHGG